MQQDNAETALSYDLMKDIYAHAEDGFNHWRDNSTAEQKEVGRAEVTRWTTDRDFAAQQQAFMENAFAEADINKNGFLLQPEFEKFVKVLMDDGFKRGNYEDPRPETISNSYMLANRIAPQAEGVTLQDWNTLCFALVGKTQELKTAAGL